MRSRWLRILFAMLWFVWTGVIIPSHTRGAIPVAGSTHSCCPQGDKTSKSTPEKPAPTLPSNCAVCHIAAKVMPAVILDVQLDAGEFVELRKCVPNDLPRLQATDPAILVRGPPVLA